MNSVYVALNNIKRSPLRTALSALSVAVSAATLSTVLALDRGYTSAVKTELVDNTGVHLYITREGCPIEAASVIAQGGLSPLYVAEEVVEHVAGLPEVSAYLPFVLFAVTTADGSRTDIFMGITEAIGTVRPNWVLEHGSWFTDADSVILGAEMALVEKLNVGERMYSEQFNREFVVAGILQRSYSQDDGMFFLPLQTALSMIGREGKLSAVAIKLNDISHIDRVRDRLRVLLPEEYFVLGSQELSAGILQFFGATRIIMVVMVIVAFAVAVLGILNTMLMTVMERRREIAYFKCVGAGPGDIMWLITIETLLICLSASAVGTLVGAAFSPLAGKMLRRFLIAFIPAGNIARPDLGMLTLSFALCVAVGVICSVYPAGKAARIRPMEVLRNE